MKLSAAYLLAMLLLLPLSVPAVGQSGSRAEIGLPYFAEHFTPEEYHAHFQNWAVAQDQRGFIYVANNHGVLEYDGTSWRLIPAQTNTIVRALAVDAEGVVYAGMQQDLGYLQPDPAGQLRYVSLLDKVDPAARDFKDVWSVHATADGVYFQTRQWLFRWNGREMQKWKASGVFHTSFVVNGRFFVRDHGRGLMEVVGDALELAPGGDRFAALAIYAMMPYPDGRILIGTRTDGFLLYDGAVFDSFSTEADELLTEYWLYGGCVLPQGDYALATLGGGVVIIGADGTVHRVLNEKSGLPDSYVNSVFADSQGGLWMAFNSQGVMRVNPTPQITMYDRRLGLEGFVEDIVRHKDTLYVATSAGLFYLDERPLRAGDDWRPTSFVKVDSVTEAVRTVVSTGDDLLAGTLTGIFAVHDGRVLRPNDVRAFKRPAEANTFSLVTSTKFPGRVYAGTKDSLLILTRTGKVWDLESVTDISGEIRSMAEEADGTLWVGTMYGRIHRLAFSKRKPFQPNVRLFDTRDGLPGDYISISTLEGSARFASGDGVYKFTGSSRDGGSGPSFELDQRFSPVSTAALDSLLISTPDDEGNLWMGYTDRIDVARLNPDGSYRRESPDVLHYRRSNLLALHIEPGGVVWLSDGDVLLRYDSRIDRSYGQPFTTQIRRVSLVGSDSLIFGGAFRTSGGAVSTTQIDEFIPVLDYDVNNLTFEFAAPSFNGVEKNRYQYYLEGADSTWSGWTTRTTAIYTNLEEGTYRFHVRARNGQGHVSNVGTFTFVRLPPWYRTWWAYGIYLVLASGLTALLMHYRKVIIENRQARVQAEQLARERLANERLQHANVKLQEANERLQQADQLKDEFLTNTSHELRTPITAILGFTSVLKEEVPQDYHEFLDIIDENSKRLLHTVSSLLDLAKLKAGVIEMNREPVDLAGQAAEVLRLLSPLASRKQIYLDVAQPVQPVYASLDRQCFERILYNLIGNAIKFTETGGVTVQIDQVENEVYIQVVDTGVGMEEAFIPHLFEEFRQESTGLARSHEGSGLGLAITARLVHLMGGRIEVQSRKNQGSTFTVVFPVLIPEVAFIESPLEGV